MKLLYILTTACLFFLVLAVPIRSVEKEIESDSASAESQVVNNLYPGLTTGALTYAVASELPQGVLLRANQVIISDKELADVIGKAPEQMQPKLKKNGLFVLEQLVTTKLFLAEATIQVGKRGEDISGKNEQAIIQDHLNALVKDVKVADGEIADFYNDNKEAIGSASMIQIKPQIEQILLQQKKQQYINEHIRNIGRKMQVEISALWLKSQAALARDNPVDKARNSGRASLVDFGSNGCVPCEMMAPILETLREKYKGKIEVLFIHVGEEPILASRYGVQSIPVQIFFDKTGREVFRHVGFFAQEQIESKLSETGLR